MPILEHCALSPACAAAQDNLGTLTVLEQTLARPGLSAPPS